MRTRLFFATFFLLPCAVAAGVANAAANTAVKTAAITTPVTATLTPTITAAEKKYFQTRDHYLARFQQLHDSHPEALGSPDTQVRDANALENLEKQLRSILGPLGVKGFDEPGKINFETLVPGDGGYDQVDGLAALAQDKRLLITNTALLANYLKHHPKLPTSLDKLVRHDDFYPRVFDWDVGVISVATLPLKKAAGVSFAHAFLALEGQDIGHFMTNTIIVFVVHGKKIAVIQSRLADQPSVMPACTEVAEVDFPACVTTHIKLSPAWPGLVRQAQALADLAN